MTRTPRFVSRELAHRDDILNAMLADPLADMIRRANEVGFSMKDCYNAVRRGVSNAQAEIAERKHVHP
jgi:hypothetical protein